MSNFKNVEKWQYKKKVIPPTRDQTKIHRHQDPKWAGLQRVNEHINKTSQLGTKAIK